MGFLARKSEGAARLLPKLRLLKIGLFKRQAGCWQVGAELALAQAELKMKRKRLIVKRHKKVSIGSQRAFERTAQIVSPLKVLQ